MATSGGQTLGVTISANMDPSGVLGAVKQMQGAFSSLKLPTNLTGDILKDFNKLQESLKKFDSIAKQDHFSKADLRNLEKLQKEIDSTFDSLKGSFNDLSGQKFYLDADYTKIKEAKVVVDELKADIQSKLSEIKIDFSSAKGGTASLGLDELIAGMERGVKSSKVLSAAMGEVKQSLKAGDFGAAANQLSQIITKSNDLKGAGTGLLNIFKQWGLIDFSTPANELVKTKKGAELLATALSKIVPEISKDNEAVQELVEKLQEAIKKKEGLEKTGAENLAKEMSTGAQSAEQLGSAFKTVGQSSREMAQGVSQAAQEVQQLQQTTQYFFSLRNQINLLKRGIREAVDVVKELDAAMTETAVVTNFSVSDMWAKLPEYTANANALGASVKDMYKSTTLYYQQGLNTEQSMGIAAETMKMARIGGLEAADATDKMTAALRGFNMEINEVSAQRINDVYSNLAAKTASNTEELGTAMQRTASIAASAGMSFEGTAAFLAQAIETTREPAENLGTAMKTIVARFQELKKNPLEIVEVDGEEVSYNKVDTALQSIGVSLKDANGQFRALDEVFLDISKRWDSLSQTQQRYIATTAAGSRQQSRFIAMMSNYSRTMELMGYATDSAGASQAQFEKTLDSMEAKVNKLQNAWNEFLMGIANDSIVKTVVDLLTTGLGKVNSIIDKLSKNSLMKALGLDNVAQSVLSITAAFMGLKATGKLMNRLIGGLGGMIDPQSGFFSGFKSGAIRQNQTASATAAAISNPIVQAIHQLQAALTNTKASTNSETPPPASYQGFKEANSSLRNLLNDVGDGANLSITKAYDTISKLDNKQQAAILQQLPGLTLSLKENGIQFNTKDISKTSADLVSNFTNEINEGLKNNTISAQQAMQIFGTADQFKQAMSARGEEYAAAASEVLFDKQYYEEQYQKHFKELDDDITNYADTLGDEEAFNNREAELQALARERAAADATAKAYEKYGEKVQAATIPGAHLANSIGNIGTVAITAGQGIAQLGMQLSNAGFAQAGALVTNLGYRISSLGQIATSVGTIIGKVKKAGGIGAILSAHPYIAAAGLVLTALTAIVTLSKAHEKEVKEAAESVVNTYNETLEDAGNKLTTLKNAKETFENLASGVDKYGNNISLTEEKYSEYIATSKEVAAIAPELIRGYDAQGNAIIDTADALDVLIEKQEEAQQAAIDTFIDDKSLNAILAGIKISNAYKNFKPTKTVQGYEVESSPFKGIRTALNQANLLDNAFSSAFAQLFGHEISLFNPSQEDLQLVAEHYDDIYNIIVSKSSEIRELSEEQQTLLHDSFVEYAQGYGDLLNEIEPLSQIIGQYLSKEGLDTIGLNLGSEFTEAFNQGLKSLEIEGLLSGDTAATIKKNAKAYAEGFKEVFGAGSEYAQIMERITKEQEKYNQSAGGADDIKKYQDAISDESDKLRELADSFANGTAEERAFAAAMYEVANSVDNYAIDSISSLTEALNTNAKILASAESAYSNFQEITKTDFSTGADNMKSIYDTVMKETDNIALHAQGKGDKTYWLGAETLFGTEAITNKTKQEVDKMFSEIEAELQAGQAGFDAFWTNVFTPANVEKLKGIAGVFIDPETWTLKWDDNINPDVFSQMADALERSDEYLTSMLNQGRQFGAIDFMDVTDVHKALSIDSAAITGTSYHRVTDSEGNATNVADIFVKGDYLKAALREANIVTPEDQENAINRLQSGGVHIIQDAATITPTDLKDMGISDMYSAIEVLGSTNNFTKEEIQAYAEKLPDFNEIDYSEMYDGWAETVDPLQSINGSVETIVSMLGSREITEGKATDTTATAGLLASVQNEHGKSYNFARGLNEAGNVMSEEQAKSNLASLQQNITDINSSLADWKVGLDTAKAEGRDTSVYEENIANLEAARDQIAADINAGLLNWPDLYAQQVKNTVGQSAVEAGSSIGQARLEAEDAYTEAKETANEIIDATYNGISEGITATDTSPAEQAGRQAGEEAVPKYSPGANNSDLDNYINSKHTTIFETQGGEETEAEISQIDKVANEGATHTTKFTEEGADAVKNIAASINNTTSKGGTIKAGVDTSAISTGVSQAASIISNTAAKIPVGVQDNATSMAKGIAKGIDKLKATIDVQVKKTGISSITVDGHTWNITAKAKGQNNHGYYSPPVIGSAARGKYGQLGPKGKGGLTLTGELGYEIAWLPSENRSMILGADGPQMINLPGDAVVWNHEQSKEILKKKQTIEAGSHSGEATYDPTKSSGSGKGKTKTKSKSKSKSKSKKKSKDKDTKNTINNFSIEEVVRFNIDQKLTALTNSIEKTTKTIEKTLSKIGITYKDILGTSQQQVANLQQVKDYNQKLVESSQRQLVDFRSQQTYISWTNSKGKSKEEKINIWDYVNEDGSMNTARIAAVGDRAKEEAIYKALSGTANTLYNNIINANKAIDEAQQKIEELEKQIYDTFEGWENEITWIYNLTQRLNNLQSLRGRFAEQITLELDKVKTGFENAGQALSHIAEATQRDNEALLREIDAQREMISARKEAINLAYSWEDEQNYYNNQLQKRLNGDTSVTDYSLQQAENDLKAAQLMRDYIKSFTQKADGTIEYDIDYEKLAAAKLTGNMSKDTYDAIKKLLDDLGSEATEQNNAIKELTASVDQIYQNIADYQQTQVDLEADLLGGLEEQTEEEANRLKDLSSALSDAMKDLLDEVKRKLDERRQQEDNAKTERDISQKQQRLAALRANTAGGNQVEIARLEKEIDEAQQSYGRTLEDQLLNKLQQQADEAAKQRERQIELLEAQVALGIDNRELVRKWVENPEEYQKEITDVLKQQMGYEEAGFLRQEQIGREISGRIVEGQNAANQLNNITDVSEKQEQIKAAKAQGEILAQELANYEQQIAAATQEVADKQNALNAKINTRNQAQGDYNNAKNALNSVQQQIVRYEQRQKESRIWGNGIGFDKYSGILKQLYREQERYQIQMDTAQSTLTGAQEAINIAQKEFDDASANLNDLRTHSEELQQTIDVNNNLLVKLESELQGLIGQSLATAEASIIIQNAGAEVTEANTSGGGTIVTAQAGEQRVGGEQKSAETGTLLQQQVAKKAQDEAAAAAAAQAAQAAPALTPVSTPGDSNPYGKTSAISEKIKKGASKNSIKSAQWSLKKLGYYNKSIDGDWGPNTNNAALAFKKQYKKAYGLDDSSTLGGGSKKALAALGYKTGGLADYTGPAWLDGTPSKPELVLNAKDTANFIALKDVLSKVMGSTKSINNSYGGDNIFEININVDKIEKDYDVDRVADRVKKKILESSSYRNVTQVRNFR